MLQAEESPLLPKITSKENFPASFNIFDQKDYH